MEDRYPSNIETENKKVVMAIPRLQTDALNDAHLVSLIRKAQQGDAAALGKLLEDFRDVAVRWAFRILKDFDLAEDAAQDAVCHAARHLSDLHTPQAFRSWFRAIVINVSRSMIRSQKLTFLPIDLAHNIACNKRNPAEVAECAELRDQIIEAAIHLPIKEVGPFLFFHIVGDSINTISLFFGMKNATVRASLHSARVSIRDRLGSHILRRPRTPEERDQVDSLLLLMGVRIGDFQRVNRILDEKPYLSRARAWWGTTPLVTAYQHRFSRMVRILIDHGAQLDLVGACFIGNPSFVKEIVERDPTSVNTFSPEGLMPLCTAVSDGNLDVVEYLLARGARPDVICEHDCRGSAIHFALWNKHARIARLLLSKGIDVTRRRGHNDDRAGWTPLHYAARLSAPDLISSLINLGGDLHALDDAGRTPLQIALTRKNAHIAWIMRQAGAKA